MRTIINLLISATLALSIVSCGNAPTSGSAAILDAARPSVSAPINPTGVEGLSKDIGDAVNDAGDSAEDTKENIKELERSLEKAKGFGEKMTALASLLETSNVIALEELKSIQAEFEKIRLKMLDDVAEAEKNLGLAQKALSKAGASVRDLETEVNNLKVSIINNENEIKRLRVNEKMATNLLRDSEVFAAKSLKKQQKLELELESKMKYFWIVWGYVAWTIVKFLGSIGVWTTPKGIIGKFLIG